MDPSLTNHVYKLCSFYHHLPHLSEFQFLTSPIPDRRGGVTAEYRADVRLSDCDLLCCIPAIPSYHVSKREKLIRHFGQGQVLEIYYLN